MIGLVLVVLALLVLFEKLPGNQVAWLVVLVCGLILLVVSVQPVNIAWPWHRREPPAS